VEYKINFMEEEILDGELEKDTTEEEESDECVEE
jgi:hypothetical protein